MNRQSDVQLSRIEATKAASKLLDIVRTNRQWNIQTADNCLPPGWELRGAEDSDFHPCNLRTFIAAYRAYARPWQPDIREIPPYDEADYF